MSASLVGSEMCIRDRRKVGDPRSVGVARRGAPRAATSRRVRRRSLDSAVSYTHLTLPTICSV
eukprot:11200479-Alexandrium_andersonii.AAC.1